MREEGWYRRQYNEWMLKAAEDALMGYRERYSGPDADGADRESVPDADGAERESGPDADEAEREPEPPRDITFLDSWNQWRACAEILQENGWLEPVEYLIQNYGLDAFEQFCLVLLTVQELDGPIFRKNLAECGFERLTPAAAVSLFQGERCLIREMYSAFLKGGRLNSWIMEIPEGLEDCDDVGPWSPIRLDGRLCRLILGGVWKDAALEEYGSWIGPQEYDESEMEAGFGEEVYRQWSGVLGDHICVLCGAEGIGKRTQLRRFAAEKNVPVFCADAGCMELLSEMRRRQVLRRLIRECSLCQAVLCLRWSGRMLRGEEENGARGIWPEAFFRYAGKVLPGLVLITEQEQMFADGSLDAVRFVFPMPTLGEAAEIWKAASKAFPHVGDLRTEEFAGMMAMTPGQIRSVWKAAARLAKTEGAKVHESVRPPAGEGQSCGQMGAMPPDTGSGYGRITERHLKEACRSLVPGSLAGKAVHVPARFLPDDLILPGDRKRQLEEACMQVKNRYQIYETWGFAGSAYGTGLSILFSGPPGTGKTMAAQVIAGELGLELYRVNLAAVVSKYIGETEKNLQGIFDEAARLQAVLFFDEADVLFARRTEVRDSHDKYSNMEAAFLLQKMEEYAGVTILATNYLQNVDEAFKRRLTYMIDFPFPDRESRRRIWERVIPEKLPLLKDADLDFLAERFELSGSQIRSSLLNAAFLAAGQDSEGVGMEHILRAVQKELRKSGRQLTQRELGEYGALLG